MTRRRDFIRDIGASTAALGLFPFHPLAGTAHGVQAKSDALPMQLFKSLSDEQIAKICLPVNHPSRKFVSNWWYVHRDHRIINTFSADQQELIQTIFDSLHHPEYRDAVNEQVEIDQYGEDKNAPSVGFFGTPDEEDFEFIYTGHHVTRRCNAHTDQGMGFGGAPIFYGHFREQFRETKDHPGNPYWYQGKLFNEFVQALDEKQQKNGLASVDPRSERPDAVIRKKASAWPGLSCRDLSADQKTLLLETMRKMLIMFRKDDVDATLQDVEKRNLIDELHLSWYGGRYDIGADRVWDTWQIEGPNMVWYYRGQPHIHSYFHLKA